MKIDVLKNEHCAQVLASLYRGIQPRSFFLLDVNMDLNRGYITFTFEVNSCETTVELKLENYPFELRKGTYEKHEDFSLELFENALIYYAESFQQGIMQPKEPAAYCLNLGSNTTNTLSSYSQLSINEIAWLEERFSIRIIEPQTFGRPCTYKYLVKEV